MRRTNPRCSELPRWGACTGLARRIRPTRGTSPTRCPAPSPRNPTTRLRTGERMTLKPPQGFCLARSPQEARTHFRSRRTHLSTASPACSAPMRARPGLTDNWKDHLLVITSPPYYGMRTYIQDQWLRHWFLGGRDEVDYEACTQFHHCSHDDFAADLARVWTHLKKRARNNRSLRPLRNNPFDKERCARAIQGRH